MKSRHVVLLVILAAFCLVVVGLARWMRPYDLETERAAVRAAGIPLSAAEIQRRAPPADQNAAVEDDALTTLLAKSPLKDNHLVASRGGRVEPEQTAALKALGLRLCRRELRARLTLHLKPQRGHLRG